MHASAEMSVLHCYRTNQPGSKNLREQSYDAHKWKYLQKKKSPFLGIPFNFSSGTMPPWMSIRDWPIFKGITIQSPQMEICYTSFGGVFLFVCFCLGSPLISAVRPWRSVRDWPVERCSQSWRNCNGVPVSHGWWCSSPKNTNKSKNMTDCQLQWRQTFWRKKKQTEA